MDSKDLSAILIKITGAILIFWYLTGLPNLLPLAMKEQITFLWLLNEALPLIIGLVFAGALFAFPSTITNKLITGEKLNLNTDLVVSLQIIAIRLIGVYHIMMGLCDLTHHFSKALLTPGIYERMGVTAPPSGWTPDLIAWVIATIVELLLALWFVIGAEGILRLIQKVRGKSDF